MNILFLTLVDFNSLEERNIYTDLLRKFYTEGHGIYVVSPVERKEHKRTRLLRLGKRQCIVKVKIGNIQKTGFIEKGISTVTLETLFVSAIKKFYSNIKFDLILYSTPPITLQRAVNYVKNRDNAITYLMLKDIFPQNAVDMGVIKKSGLGIWAYRYFRHKEKKLYTVSDYIGCMSEANVDYVVKHNLKIDSKNVEVCPNSLEIEDMRLGCEERNEIRLKYKIPLDKKVFVYGGNLGKPQGISFLIKCLKAQLNNPESYFLIIGDGTEYGKLESFFQKYQPINMNLLKKLPKKEYEHMIAACDVGMIFLDYRFRIPNFPSRLLSYMQAGLPVLACTDKNTDIGKVIVDGSFGWWCESNNVKKFCYFVEVACKCNLNVMGNKGYQYMCENYNVNQTYETIMNHFV